MTLTEISQMAQIAVAFLTLLAVAISLFFSIRALREVRSDRVQRQRPHLAFERGGFRYPIRFLAAGHTIPGIDPKSVQRYFPALPAGAQSVRLDHSGDSETGRLFHIGRLKNFGLGPALSVRVAWVAKEVWIGNERFEIGESKSKEAAYCLELNIMPLIPAHLPPGGEGGLSRIPTFIEKDIDKKVTRASGCLLISAQDVFKNSVLFKQDFEIFTGYSGAEPWFHVTFGDLVYDDA